jgi:hypothetical protein
MTYPGAPHGLTATMPDQVNADLLAFIGSYGGRGHHTHARA